MNYSKDLRLDELGISSDEEAEELESVLELHFEDFTPKDRETWLQQNAYLDQFSQMGTTTSAASRAGVTVYTAQRWQYDNVLGFNHRLEVATLTFNDRLQHKALLRASDPKAPATLLIELLRSNIPEKFSKNGHKCDKSKSLEQLRRYREKARREKEAGYPTLMRIARGDPDPYRKGEHQTQLPHHSPAGGDTQRGGSSHPTEPLASVQGRYQEDVHSGPVAPDQAVVTPSSPRPYEGLDNPDNRGPDTGASNASPTEEGTSDVHPSHDGVEMENGDLPRAKRREQLRQQRKREKKNVFKVVRF